jgi:hypothetical protein
MKRWAARRRIVVVVALLVAASSPGSAGAQVCIGDCPPANMQVAVNELVRGVSIALGSAMLATCPSYDVNGNGAVGVEELVSAVGNALRGCGGGAMPTPTMTRRPTWTPAPGPVISFFAVVSADDSLQTPIGTNPDGIPIFARPFGSGFKLVVEADGVFSGAASTYADGGVPALQIQSTNALGDGSPAVCDVEAPIFGGVPAVNPPQLENPDAIADVLNDFGCRFIDGEGNRVGRSCAEGCVRFVDGEYHCVSEATDRQFCAPVDMPLQFPDGDTLVSVRVRDDRGLLGGVAQLIVRVGQ